MEWESSEGSGDWALCLRCSPETTRQQKLLSKGEQTDVNSCGCVGADGDVLGGGQWWG